MAYESADYRKVWASSTVVELRQQAIWLNLTSQRHTGPWVAGANSVFIPKPDWSASGTEGVQAATRARGADWATARAGDQDVVTFTRSGGYSTSNEVLWEDAVELPWPAVERTRSRQTYEMGKQIDGAIYTAIRGGLGSGSKTKFGSDTNSIARTAPYAAANDTARAYPREILDAFALKMERADADGPGDSVGTRYAVMAPEIFTVFALDMLKEGYGWDLLTADLIRNNSVLAAAGFKGRYKGIDVMSWNGVSIPTGATDWIINCGAREGVAADVRPPLVQFMTPEQNQVSTKPANLLRQAGDYGYAELTETLLHEYSIDGGS